MVIKRNGSSVEFDKNRITRAINKAMKSAKGKEILHQSREIAEEIEKWANGIDRDITIYEIENKVHDKLCERGNFDTARAYTEYKALRAHSRKDNTSDPAIDSLLKLTDKDQIMENSNKNSELVSTQRDLIAGEISKDLVQRKILPLDLVQAHKDATIHIHDMDYMISPMFNCCLVDYGEMLEHGTVINGKMVEKPKSFQVACTVLTQIIAQIASNQYGLI